MVKRLEMESKVDPVDARQWLERKDAAALSTLWLSPSQRNARKVGETCSQLSALFDALRTRYLATHSRAQKLAGVLERMTRAYDDAAKKGEEAVFEKVPKSNVPF